LAVCATSVGAQISVAQQNNVTVVTNDLPVRLMALTHSSSTREFDTVAIPARGQLTLPAGGMLLAIEPVTIEVGRTAMFAACTSVPGATTDARQILKELMAIEFLEPASARERIEAASARANLDIA